MTTTFITGRKYKFNSARWAERNNCTPRATYTVICLNVPDDSEFFYGEYAHDHTHFPFGDEPEFIPAGTKNPFYKEAFDLVNEELNYEI